MLGNRTQPPKHPVLSAKEQLLNLSGHLVWYVIQGYRSELGKWITNQDKVNLTK